MIKKLIILLIVVGSPFIIGLLFTYDVIKLDWVSFMEIQPSFKSQEDPLPLPPGSIPVQGAVFIAGVGAPTNPVPADEVSLARGKQFYAVDCALCHGPAGKGNGPYAAFLTNKPANLLIGNARNNSDGAIFLVVSNGVGGKMPALKENLPGARERWDVVNYVRELQKQAQP
jgi:mono/diheme cytochrome c family protein